MSLSSIRTWGWFPTSAGGDASISSIRTWGWLFDEEGPPPETPVAAIFSLPIETLLSLSNNFDLPIENIGGVSINAINNLPIENVTLRSISGEQQQLDDILISEGKSGCSDLLSIRETVKNGKSLSKNLEQ